MLKLFYCLLLLPSAMLSAQSPEIRSWIVNSAGTPGYNGIASNVQKVEYSNDWVYVSATCIPGYDIGPWAGNPNTPANQNFVFKLTRSPQFNNGTPTATPRGHIGIWTNGVSIFNAMDARSYNNQNIWNQNAIVVEAASFDDCLGHPAPNGEYHHHLNPRCLYDDRDSSRHSPLIGYAFDGFPVYGAYGGANGDGSGPITRMRSSYRLRSITDRTTLPNGTALSPAQHGPAISAQYPLGYYLEDFEYVAGLGDLDEHNGRFGVTPEYPAGIYAYFVTLDESGNAAFPYVLGPNYRGVVPPGNTGPQSGHNVPTEPVTLYLPSRVAEADVELEWSALPNPATGFLRVIVPAGQSAWRVSLCDVLGREVLVLDDVRHEGQTSLDLDGVAAGIYHVRLQSLGTVLTRGVVVQ